MNIKEHILTRIMLLGVILFILSGCFQPTSSDQSDTDSGRNQGQEEDDEDDDEDDDVPVAAPELKQITVNPATAPAIGVQITATAVYQSTPGSVTWQWTADGVIIEGKTTAVYTPVPDDFNKTLEVRATPSGTTKGDPKTHSFEKVTVKSDTNPPVNTSPHSVTGIYEVADKYYINTGSAIYTISEGAYNTIKLVFDKNKDNGAIQFFKFPFAGGGNLTLNNTLTDQSKKIRLTIDESLTGTKDKPLIVTIPRIPSSYMDIDQLLYYKTPVYLIGSDSGEGANAKYVDIVVENGGYLYIPYDEDNPQNFKGLIRAKADAVVVDDGGTQGYSAGTDAFYWFEYGSYCWVSKPTGQSAPFIATEPYLQRTNKPGIIWDSSRPDSFIWVGNNTFLLQGKIKQVQPFGLSAHLLLTPGAEFIIDIQTPPEYRSLRLEGKNIAKWLPNPSEDYYEDLTRGGTIYPEPEIHIIAGSAIIDSTGTSSSVDYICTDEDNLTNPPQTIWVWNSEKTNEIPIDDNIIIKGKWEIKPANP